MKDIILTSLRNRWYCLLHACIVLVLLCGGIEAMAGNALLRSFDFRRLDMADGLSQSNVKAILEDKYGFMWFGTKKGLARYDGTAIRMVECYDHQSGRGNDNIGALMEDEADRLWVGTDAGVYLYGLRDESFRYFDVRTEDGEQISNWIKDIRTDSVGNVWVVVPNQGVFRYDGERLHSYYITARDRYITDNPECITILRNGDVWVGTNHAGLFHYDAQRDTFVQYLKDRAGHSFASDNIYALCEYKQGLAVACHEGILKIFDFEKQSIRRLTLPGVDFPVLRDIECFDGQRLWLGTAGGLFVIDETDGHLLWNHYTENVMSGVSGLSDNVIYTLYSDRNRNIWVGTMFGGVCYYLRNSIPFTSYVPGASFSRKLSSRKVRGLAQGPDGRVWIGTEDGGVNVLNPRMDELHVVAPNLFNRAELKQVLTVMADGEKIVCGLFKQGLVEIDARTEQARHFTPESLGLDDEGSVGCYFRDSRGTVWIANLRRVYCLNHQTGRFEPFEKMAPHWISQIFEDTEGDIWFTTYDSGVFRYNFRTGCINHYRHDEDNPSSISQDGVNSGFVDSRGRIWFTSERGGISCLDRRTGNFTNIGKREGLPDNATYNMLEDKAGNLWFGTNDGLVRFHPADTTTVIFTYEDGLPSNQFNFNSALRTADGRFYFGTLGGLVSFGLNEETSTNEFSAFPLRLTRLYINSEEQSVGRPGSPLREALPFTREIRLNYQQNNLTLDFAALKTGAGHNLSYYYRLLPTDDEWRPTQPSLTFSQLLPGRYMLCLRAVDNRTTAKAETELTIIITPPWWRSIWAYLVYTIGLIVAIFYAMRYWRDRTANKFREQQRLFELEKEKELFRSKVEFFTEISHEIRTPLTLINGSLEAIAPHRDRLDSHTVRHLSVMSQNVHRLLDLNHQLLDFRKVGMQRYTLSFTHVDVTALLRETVSRFEPGYQQSGKTLRLEPVEDNCMADIDKEAVVKILSNLLNNALKYAAGTAVVSLYRQADTFTVVVSSDGEHIDPSLAERIFAPFFRIKQDEEGMPFGVGIGLPMARSLAEMHRGTLKLDGAAVWNDFVLTLPLHQDNVVQIGVDEEEILAGYDPEESDVNGSENTSKAGRSVVLLVEDNTQVQSVVGERLREYFNVWQAYNGEEALAVLAEQAVDIVVTDIMMPVMDGVELCRRIKADEALSHLPVVFLTAKNMTEDRVDGLRVGAEAYIEKPFVFDVLKETVSSILANRRRAQELFSRRPVMPVKNLKMNKHNEEFIEKLILCVQRNFLNEQFSVEMMAEEFCMSRSALLRKIKSLTNLSAIDFIKVVRLRRAAELIKEGKYRIAEIGYMVGISTPSYFGKLFQKQFGMTPKKFEQMCAANEPTEDLLGDLVVPHKEE